MTRPDPDASLADAAMLQDALAHVFAPWVRELDLRVLETRAGEVTLAVMTRLGGFRPMTTVQLQTSFLRPVSGQSGAAHATTTYALP